MVYPFYLILGVLPSLIWLCFFLRKDVHPESSRMILKIFFWGMLSAIPAALIEIGFSEALLKFEIKEWILVSVLYWFLGIALVEEIIKYLVVRNEVLNDPEFDEPVDAILYMIIAALGFAALENILIFWPGQKSFTPISGSLAMDFFFRFIGPTFLHALCSGVVGLFLGLAFFKKELRSKLTILGLIIAILLHGLYNFSIMEIEGNLKLAIPIFVLISLLFVVSLGFKKLQNMSNF